MRSFDLGFKWSEMYLTQNENAEEFDKESFNSPKLLTMLDNTENNQLGRMNS